MRLMVAEVVLLASRSKCRQKVEKSSKSPKNLKGLKSCKGHWFGGTFIKAPVLRQQRTWASVRTLTVFWALFTWPKSHLDTTFASIIDKAKLIELLMRCPHQVPICAAHMFPPLLQLWDALRVLRHQDDSRTRYARSPSTQILQMRSGRRRPSPESAWWLGGCRGSGALPKPVLRSWDHQNWAD